MSGSISDQSARVGRALQLLWSQLEQAAGPYFLWKALYNRIATDEDLRRRLNAAAIFWNSILQSLQTDQFVGIGRIFDRSKGSFSVYHLEKICTTNLGAFSQAALQYRKGWVDLDDDEFTDEEERQLQEEVWLGRRPGWKREYISNAAELSLNEVKHIFSSLDDAKAIYEKGARVARNKTYAHIDYNAHKQSVNTHTNVFVGEFERMIDDVHTVHWMLRGVFDNGHPAHRVPRRYVWHKEAARSVETVASQILCNKLISNSTLQTDA